MKKLLYLSLVGIIILTNACKKSETFTTDTINDYAPYEVGKYITYKLDSLKYINLGTKDTVISYEVKYQVDAEIMDNLNRPAFRIVRFIRKEQADPWISDNTFMVVSENKTLEFIENNMRFIKLKEPIYNGYSWKGNSYIDTESQDSEFKYLSGWDYTYDSVNEPITLGNFNIPFALTIHQRDEVLGNPGNPNVYSEINFSEEKYAKGIGMIYKKFLHAEYQGNTHNYSDGSYGITLTMIDHN